jgi:hypothetical protein
VESSRAAGGITGPSGIVQFSRPARPFDVFEREAATFLATQMALLLSNSAPEA